MTADVKKVWITKYWETKGVYQIDAATTDFPNMISELGPYWTSYHKPWWHDTEAEAIAHANAQLVKKIAATEKKLNKLKKMKF